MTAIPPIFYKYDLKDFKGGYFGYDTASYLRAIKSYDIFQRT